MNQWKQRKSEIVRAKLHPLECKFSCYRFGNMRCIASKDFEGTDTFSSKVKEESPKINRRLVCNDKHFIYLLTNKVYEKWYTGKAADKSILLWNNYKESDKEFLRRFLYWSHKGFIEDFSICLIDKTKSSEPHKNEYYWMRSLKPMHTEGTIYLFY